MPRGFIAADGQTQATSLRGVFAGGDIVTGGATVILAMAAGGAPRRRSTTGCRASAPSGGRRRPRPTPPIPPTRPALPPRTERTEAMLCPRCQRPLADDAEGPTSAAPARLQWRCDCACGKLSEGFRCPTAAARNAAARCRSCEGGGPARGAGVARGAHGLRDRARRRAFYQRAAATATTRAAPAVRPLRRDGRRAHGTLARRYHLDVPAPRRPSASRWRRCSPTWRTAAGSRQPVPHRHRAERAAAFFTEHADAAPRARPRRAVPRTGRRGQECEHARHRTAALAAGPAGLFGACCGREPGGELGRRPDQRRRAAAAAGHDAERIALVCGDQQLTHGELRDRVARAAAVVARGWSAATASPSSCPTGWTGWWPSSARCGRAAPRWR